MFKKIFIFISLFLTQNSFSSDKINEVNRKNVQEKNTGEYFIYIDKKEHAYIGIFYNLKFSFINVNLKTFTFEVKGVPVKASFLIKYLKSIRKENGYCGVSNIYSVDCLLEELLRVINKF